MQNAVGRFSSFVQAHPSVVSAALEDEFGVASLGRAARQHGFDIDSNDVVSYLNADGHGVKPTVRFMFKDESGEMRELTLEEAQDVGGGFTLAAVAITVLVVVVAGAAVITATYALISTTTWAHTSTSTYASEPPAPAPAPTPTPEPEPEEK